jgi:type I restriction enzyme M protein
MPNERTTEDIVRSHLKNHGVPKQIVSEQNSDDPKIKKALSKASKSGEGIGKPEFILQLKDDPDFLLIVECKADPSKHESLKRNKSAEYAVDGALLYSAHLAKHFDVISIAASG